MLQVYDHLRGPILDPFQQDCILLELGASGLDAVQGQRQPPLLPILASPLDAVQDSVGLPGCKSTLLAHDQLFTHQNPQVLLRRTALSVFSLLAHIAGITSTQVQYLHLALLNLIYFLCELF